MRCRRLLAFAFCGMLLTGLVGFHAHADAQEFPPPRAAYLRPLRVFDATGRAVGYLISNNQVVVKVDDQFFRLPATPSTGLGNADVRFLHRGPSCGGPRYKVVNASPDDFFSHGDYAGGRIVRANGPGTTMSFCGACPDIPDLCPSPDSLEVISPGNDPSQPGICEPYFACGSEEAEYTTSISFIALPPFTPPFHLE